MFRAPDRPKGPPFTIVLPPPNITGLLTLGHMLGDTAMDILVRWHRMRGDPTLWLPGVDHAGLSTQVEVRRRLAKQGIRLDSMSREEVLARVEEWRREHEPRILEQIRAGGFSVDWSRYRYTMDPGMVRATRDVFVRLFNEGLIYRGQRIVNWDPRLRTAVSDLEVVHREEEGRLLYVRYPWADGTSGGLVVATVRPETIFGDVAVAVHPDDDRHRASVGRSVRVPLTDRVVPVISDSLVDPAFGNGALKVTPRHDLLDFEISRKHAELPMPPSILTDAADLTGDWVPERFRGMDREKARAEVTQALEAEGVVERSESIRHSVGRSERTGAVIEPMLSTQWFVRMRPLAGPVVEAVRRGDVRIHPERWTLTFFRWMEELEDWCISRQVAWGHPIPVYHCGQCHRATAAASAPAECPFCAARDLTPDPDVLDTWFTSWLWPFASLGWPDPTPDLEHYYPTSVLVTGRDIMFFWVARMLMAGFHFTGRRPFSDVVYTGMLRDDEGRRMSKHLGNSPDPLEVIRERGADALRFAMVFPNPVDQDGPFGAATLDGARNFLTKLWNLGRLAGQHTPEGTEPPRQAPKLGPASALPDRWVLSRWHATAEEVDQALEGYEFTRAAGRLYAFLWHDLADRYVEVAKEALLGRRGEPAAREARGTLRFVLERALRMLHPFAPHVTEELWHALPHDGELLAQARWPAADEVPRDREAEGAMEIVLDAVRVGRNLKADHSVAAAFRPAAAVRPATPAAAAVLREHGETVVRLARLERLDLLEPGASSPSGAASAVTSSGEFFVVLPAEAKEAESATLEREREKLHGLLTKTRERLADAGFRARAPKEVVREAEEKVAELTDRLERIDEHLRRGVPEEASP